MRVQEFVFNLFLFFQGENLHTLKGQVLDFESKSPLPFASVTVFRIPDSTKLTGTTSDAEGFFEIRLPQGTYYVEISYIGYQPLKKGPFQLSIERNEIDFGKIFLKRAPLFVEEIVTKAEKPHISYEADKQVIHVGKTPLSYQGTVLDVLKNIPQIQVDPEGNIKIRGIEKFTIYINSRPTPLEPQEVLQTMPVSQVDRIEIITTPGAKYSPEGEAGIINIILKEKIGGNRGYSLNLAYGSFSSYSLDGMYQWKSDRIGLFVSFSSFNRGRPSSFESYQEINSIPINSSFGTSERRFFPMNFRWSFQYNLSPRLSVNFSNHYGIRRMNFETSAKAYKSEDTLTSFSYSKARVPNMFFELYLKAKLNLLDITGGINFSTNRRKRINEINVSNEESDGNLFSYKTTLKGPLTFAGFKLEAERNFDNSFKLSWGIDYQMDDMKDFYEIQYSSTSSGKDTSWVRDFLSHRENWASYLAYSKKIGKLAVQMGVRYEDYFQKGYTSENPQECLRWRRRDLFPSLHFSFTSKKYNLQGGYSRRTWRPRPYQLHSSLEWIDPNNVRKGNPDLKPEFTHSLEVNNQYEFHRRLSMNLTLFYKYTDDFIEMTRTPIDTSQTILVEFRNLGIKRNAGIEASLELLPLGRPIFKVIPTWSGYYEKLQGREIDFERRTENFVNNFSLIFDVNIKGVFNFQTNFRYSGKRKSLLSETSPIMGLDLGSRILIPQYRVLIIFQVQNLFWVPTHKTVTERGGGYITDVISPRSPSINLLLIYDRGLEKTTKKLERQEEDTEIF